jgi:hypothetical protein
MIVDLMAEMPAGDRYAEAARGWLEGVLEEMFPDLREGLRSRPSTRVINMHWDDGPEGEPGQVRGELGIGLTSWRARTVIFTEASWQRFLGSLSKSPVTASLCISVVGEDGYLSDDGAVITADRPEEEPGWARFTVHAPAWFMFRARGAEGTWLDGMWVKVPGPGGGWTGSAELQDGWAGVVKGQAGRVGACAGMITNKGGGPAILEAVTYPDWPPERVVQPPDRLHEVAMLGAGRDVLYRYSWVTIIPPELAPRLGGAVGLTASGAFFEVTELAGGAVWLRATRTIEEFDQSRSAAVAAALAPVLVAATNL